MRVDTYSSVDEYSSAYWFIQFMRVDVLTVGSNNGACGNHDMGFVESVSVKSIIFPYRPEIRRNWCRAYIMSLWQDYVSCV
jgi:hypothetical protein